MESTAKGGPTVSKATDLNEAPTSEEGEADYPPDATQFSGSVATERAADNYDPSAQRPYHTGSSSMGDDQPNTPSAMSPWVGHTPYTATLSFPAYDCEWRSGLPVQRIRIRLSSSRATIHETSLRLRSVLGMSTKPRSILSWMLHTFKVGRTSESGPARYSPRLDPSIKLATADPTRLLKFSLREPPGTSPCTRLRQPRTTMTHLLPPETQISYHSPGKLTL